MERRGKMDVAGPASDASPLITKLFVFLFLTLAPFFTASLSAQTNPSGESQTERAKQFFEAGQWQQLLDLASPLPDRSAEMDYYYGSALAHVGRWSEAEEAFRAGARLSPQDERFPLERAGVAFKQKRYRLAARHLHQALRLKPGDPYAINFLATVYFLEQNVEAALKYWNQVKKPRIVDIQYEPPPKVNPILLDKAFAFSPAATLTLPEFRATEARLRGMEIFSSLRLDLAPRTDGSFDTVFNNKEKNGWGRNKWEILFSLFRSLPALTIRPDFYNLKHRAINFTSLYRWDTQKRRVRANLTGPLFGEATRRFYLGTELRNENWDIRESFKGPTPALGSLNLRREAVYGGISSVLGGSVRWSAGGELSHRDFRSVIPGSVLTPDLLTEGFQLKQVADLQADLLRIPERRIVVHADISSQLGRIWAGDTGTFEKIRGLERFHWFPMPEDDDYEFDHRIGAGKIFGDAPFDELFMMGVGGDSDVLMRAHVPTHKGRKGSGPLGTQYFVSNMDFDKRLYRFKIVTFKIGPFLDIGRMTDNSGSLNSRKWLFDLGVQLKAKVYGFEVAFSYGKDLRSGNDAFRATVQ